MLVFVDTAPFIYFLEHNSEYHATMVLFFNHAYDHGIQMITSALTLTEICTKPYQLGKPTLAAKYREYFTNSELLVLREVDGQIADEAARIRAKHKLRTPDSIQLATANIVGADVILTNDLAWQGKAKGKVIPLNTL